MSKIFNRQNHWESFRINRPKSVPKNTADNPRKKLMVLFSTVVLEELCCRYPKDIFRYYQTNGSVKHLRTTSYFNWRLLCGARGLYRSCCPQVFYKIAALDILAKFKGKLQFIKRTTSQVFSCEFYEIF